MDWNKLQHTLFALDPTDPAEDLRKLRESASRANNIAPTKDYVVESVEVAQGSMPVDGNYSIADFAALAGVTLTEAQKKGSAGQLKGKDAIKKLPAGTTKNATRNKLVGEDFQIGDPNYNRSATIDKGIDKIKQLTDPNYNKFGTDKTKSVGDKLAKPGTPTQKESNLLDPKLTANLLPYEEQLKAIFYNVRIKAKFEEFLNLYVPQTKKTAEAQIKIPMPKERNPNWRQMDGIRKSGAGGVHKNKAEVLPRKEKHKGKKEYTTESIKEMLYRKLNESK